MALYSDLNRRTPRIAPQVVDFEAVLQAVENLLRTPPRQRLFHPDGVDLDSLLFELDVDTEWRVKNEIFSVLGRDDRVQMLYDQTSVTRDPDNNRFPIVVKFKVVGLGDRVFARKGYVYAGGGL